LERRRQTSLSMALGARPSRLVRQPLIESVLLSLMGGAAGLAIAFAGTRLILQIAFPTSAGQGSVPISASPSMPVLLFAFAVSLVTGVVFGIAPAWMATRADPIEALRGSGRSTARTGSLSRKMLVVLQTALSLVLLSAAGLLTAALQNLEHQNLGFDPDRRVVANINAKLAGYRPAQLSQLYQRLHEAIAAIPGASASAISLYAPPAGGWGSGVFVDGRPEPGPGDDNSSAWDRVTPGYFDAVGTPLAAGRAIASEDTATSRHVAVISAAFARKFFPHEDPIGKRFGRTPVNSREFEIVGVVKDARYWTPRPDRPIWPMFFLPESQAEYAQGNLGSLYLHDVVVAARPGASISEASVRAAVSSVDPNLPIASIRPMRDLVADQFIQQRLLAQLTSFFGILSLLLASIGLYGVTAYNAGQRTNEIGVRIALGASRADVVRLVLRGAFVLILAGLSIGLPLTFVAGRFLGSQLHGLNPDDPAVMLAAVGALGLSALLASLVPALRASAISPLDSLRSE
jgi:predicted permease